MSLNLFNLLEMSQINRADDIAIIDGNSEYTYAELYTMVNSIAGQLAGLGVRPGDRIAIHLNKGVEEIVAIFAVARIGAVFVNINYRLRFRQLKHIISDCDIRVMVTDRRRASAIIDCRQQFDSLDKLLVVEGLENNGRQYRWNDVHGDVSVPQARPIGSELAAILYTSGSTGNPKGVMLTHENIVQGAQIVSKYLNNQFDDRILSLVPLSFDYGLNQLTKMCLIGGAVVLQKTAMPSAIVDTITSKNVTGMAAVPPVWVETILYLKQSEIQLPSLRYITNTGGKIPNYILDRIPEVLPAVDIYLMYGFTEAFRSTFLPPERFFDKKGSIGMAIPNVEVFVVDPQRGLCADNEIGELVHCGALISKGYWGDKRATVKKIHPCKYLESLIGNKPVAFSGDLVKRDDEGFLWFVSRMDDMIKSSGHRISPTEVEEIVYESGYVEYAVAFGVADDLRGEIVFLVISGLCRDFDRNRLLKHCREHMPTYMVPEKIIIWNGKMPKTNSGKIDRRFVVDKVKGISA